MTVMLADDVEGQTPAWAVLEEHRPTMVRLAKARGCSHEDAEDLAGEALVRAATYRGLDPDRAGAFLNTVLLRLIVDKHRREQRHLRSVARVAEPDHVGSHEEAVCERYDAGVALRRLAELPPTERAVLVTRAEGHSVAATAALLHLSQKRVEGAYTQARGRVRRMLLAGLVAFAAGLRRNAFRAPALLAVPAAFLLLPVLQPATAPMTHWSTGERTVGHVVADTRPSSVRPAVPSTLHSRQPRHAAPVPRRVTTRPAPPIITTHARSYDNDRTLLQSVRDCLDRGPDLNTTTIGCSPSR